MKKNKPDLALVECNLGVGLHMIMAEQALAERNQEATLRNLRSAKELIEETINELARRD